MPDEPNRNIEEQLRAFARKRREESGAPPELHPATRRLLQEEVARTYSVRIGQPAPQPRRNWLMFLWPRMAFALPVVAVVAVLLALWTPSLTKNKSKGTGFEIAQQDKKLSGEEFRRAEGQEKLGEQVRLRSEPPSATAPSSGPAPAQAPAVVGEGFAEADRSKDALTVKAEALRDDAAQREARKSAESMDRGRTTEAPPLAEATPPARGLAAEQTVTMRRRYGLTPATQAQSDESVGRLALSPSPTPESRAPSTFAGGKRVEPQLALNGTTRGAAGGALAARSDTGAVAATTAGQTGVDSVALAFKAPTDTPALQLGAPVQMTRAETTGAVAYFYSQGAHATQRFAQAQNYRRNFNSPPIPDVLNSFQLAQNGRQITIVDADGSTYEGQIEAPKPEAEVSAKFTDLNAANELRQLREADVAGSQAAASPQDGVGAAQNVMFRVAGTNRTLNQPVVFVGNLLVVDTNALTVNNVRAAVTLEAQAAAAPVQNAPVQNQLLLQNARVQGQATIGDRNRIEVNAVPAEP